MPLILDVEKAYDEMKDDPEFREEFKSYLKHYVGRPTALFYAERLTKSLAGAKIYFKREDLNHTSAHKVNNCMGQILLAKRMGKNRIIAETGAGMHGVATATVCALFDLPCTVYMGAKDIERQARQCCPHEVIGRGDCSGDVGIVFLEGYMNDALRDWVANVGDTYYLIGTVAGPHPYPTMVGIFSL